jgi:hypothetical protein
MSTVSKKSDHSSKIVFGLIGVAALIMLGCLAIFVVKVAGSMGFGEGQQLRTGLGGIKSGQTYLQGEDASVLKPEEVARAFLTEIGKEQFEEAYQRTSSGFQGRMSQADFNEMIRQNKALIRHLSWRTKGTTKASGTLIYRGVVSGGPNGSCEFTLKIGQDGDGWRVYEFTVP